jgi:hypothetical protein
MRRLLRTSTLVSGLFGLAILRAQDPVPIPDGNLGLRRSNLESDPDVLGGCRRKELEKLPWFGEAQKRLATHREYLEKQKKEMETTWGEKTAGIVEKKMKEALGARGLTAGESQSVVQGWDVKYRGEQINALYRWVYEEAIRKLEPARLGDLPAPDAAAAQKYNLVVTEIIEGTPPRPAPPMVTPFSAGPPRLPEQTSATQEAVAKLLRYERAPVDEVLQQIDAWMELVKHDYERMAQVLPEAIDAFVRREASERASGALSARGTEESRKAAEVAGDEARLWALRGDKRVVWFSKDVAWDRTGARSTHEVRCTSPKVPLPEALHRIEVHVKDLEAGLDAFAKARQATLGTKISFGNWEFSSVLQRYHVEGDRLAAWLDHVRRYHEFGPQPEDLAALDAAMEKFKKAEKKMLATVEKFLGYQREIDAGEKQVEQLRKQMDAAAKIDGPAGEAALAKARAEYDKADGQLSKVRTAFSEESGKFYPEVENEAVIADPPKGRVREIWLRSDKQLRDTRGSADYIREWDGTELVAGVRARVMVDFTSDLEEAEIAIELAAGGGPLVVKARPEQNQKHLFTSDPFVIAPPKSAAPARPPDAATAPPKPKPVEDGTPTSPIAGEWNISYTDRALGEVAGIATVSVDGKAVEVELTHPKTGAQTKLESTEVREKDGFYTIVFEGASPSAEALPVDPEDTAPDPMTLPHLDLGADTAKVAVTIREAKGEKFISPRVEADRAGHLELRLRYDQPPKMDRAAMDEYLKSLPEGVRANTEKLLAPPKVANQMQGWWSFRADSVTWRDAGGGGRIGSFRRDFREPHYAWEFGRENWKRRLDGAQIQLLAQTVAGPMKVTRFFEGVPTMVEAVFREPQKETSKVLTITVGGKELRLTATRDEHDLRRFVTEVIVPSKAGGRTP